MSDETKLTGEVEVMMFCDLLGDGDGPKAAGVLDRAKALAGVVRGLVGGGVVKATDVWTWIPVILQLIQTLGPMVTEIIDAVKKAIGKGQTPQTFAA